MRRRRRGGSGGQRRRGRRSKAKPVVRDRLPCHTRIAVDAVAAKAPRKVLGGGSSTGSSSTSAGSPSASKNNKYSGGNGAHPRPTPDWQKGIDGFFRKENKEDADPSAHEEQESPSDKTGTDYSSEPEDVQSSSSSSQKKARISSDEDDD